MRVLHRKPRPTVVASGRTRSEADASFYAGALDEARMLAALDLSWNSAPAWRARGVAFDRVCRRPPPGLREVTGA